MEYVKEKHLFDVRIHWQSLKVFKIAKRLRLNRSDENLGLAPEPLESLLLSSHLNFQEVEYVHSIKLESEADVATFVLACLHSQLGTVHVWRTSGKEFAVQCRKEGVLVLPILF